MFARIGGGHQWVIEKYTLLQKYLTSRDALPNSPYAKIDRFYKNLSIFFSTYDKLDVNQNKI